MPRKPKIVAPAEPLLDVAPVEHSATGPMQLDLKRPLCTKKHKLKYIAKTDGKLLMQSIDTGAIVVTDFYGIDPNGHKRVYNGAPEDYRIGRIVKVSPGDQVFVMRTMAQGKKVFSARVVSVEPNRTVVVDVNDRDHFPMSSKRKFGDSGYLVFPPTMVFSNPQDIEDYARSVLNDLTTAKTAHRQALEMQNEVKKA